VGTPTGPVALPAPPARWQGTEASFAPIPALGAHTEAVRREFLREPAA
jgi:itaconate CoA-transferase